MDRLTITPCKNKAGCRLEKQPNVECCYAGCVNFQKVIDRLAAYEDTGRSPDEVAALDNDVAMLKQSARTANEFSLEVNRLREELKKETELRIFFEKASRFIGQENFKAFAEGSSRYCMCPGAICPGIPGTPHQEPSPCRLNEPKEDKP